MSDKKLGDGGKSHRYKLLNDVQWLHDRYVVEGLSTKKIAKLVGAKTPNSVRQALQRASIEIRSVSDGLTINREDDGFVLRKDVIEGGLLGDAGLRIWNKHSDASYPSYTRKNKYKDHVKWASELICDAAAVDKKIKLEIIKKNGKTFKAFRFRTLCHKELLPLYRLWYPESSGFKKVIPQDLEINEVVLLHWFLDDGSTSYIGDTKQVELCFCSESFTKHDQERLCDTVHQSFPELTPKIRSVNFGTGWRIRIPQSQARVFFDIIGPSPIVSLAYKWKG